VAELFSRLHPGAILYPQPVPFQVTSPPNGTQSKNFPDVESLSALEHQSIGRFVQRFIGFGFLVLLLLPYIAIALFGAWWFLRAKYRAWKLSHPVRHRIYFAAYLAIVFTPSVITDFWLFMIPGPAFVGLTLLFPAILFSESRAAILYIITLYYILPMLGGFTMFYLSLWGYSRLRRRSLRRSA
jgi:hypothetical protein